MRTFAANARVAAHILKAWKDAGVPEKEIATNALTSHLTTEDDLRNMTPAERKEKQYEANQSWRITEKPESAEKMLDIAVDAGANDVGEPDWSLADPDSSEAQAYAFGSRKSTWRLRNKWPRSFRCKGRFLTLCEQ